MQVMNFTHTPPHHSVIDILQRSLEVGLELISWIYGRKILVLEQAQSLALLEVRTGDHTPMLHSLYVVLMCDTSVDAKKVRVRDFFLANIVI
jgi:hypothetical protein